MPKTFSSSHIAPQTGGFEPQRPWAFTVEIPGVVDLSLSVHTAFHPHTSNSPEEIEYFSDARRVAGRATHNGGTITCIDYIDQQTHQQLLDWRKLVYDVEKGGVGLASEYKKEGTITMYGPNASTDSARTWKITGCWPEMVDGDGFDYGGAGVYRVNLHLVVDTIIPTFVSGGGSGTPGVGR